MSVVRGFSSDAQRRLDGGPHGPLDPAEQAAAERLLAAAAELGRGSPVLDASLDDRVMAAVRGRSAASPARRRAAWRWLVEPSVRPVWIPLAAAAAALVMWLGGRTPSALPVAPGVEARAAAADTVYVRFELTAPDARLVAVAGSFNSWSADALPMTRRANGTWAVTVPLPIGEHQYQFVVDGRQWRPDPTAHAQVDDGFGGTNSVIVIGRKGLVRT